MCNAVSRSGLRLQYAPNASRLWATFGCNNGDPPGNSYCGQGPTVCIVLNRCTVVDRGAPSVHRLRCGKQEPTCGIWYPADLTAGPFPVASFAHGIGGGLVADLLDAVASMGFIVVAPATSKGACESSFWPAGRRGLLV